MDKVFELVYKSGPHGDACTTYTLKIKEGTTLKDFLKSLNPQEWGEVRVNIPDPETSNLPYATESEKYKNIDIEYKYGKILKTSEDFTELLNCQIDLDYNNWANGGWSCMDYWIKIKNV